MTELVEQALNFQPADTPADKLAKLSVGLARGGFPGDEAVPLLAEWLDLPPSAGYIPLQTNADVKRHKTLVTLAAWNLKLGELQPLVLMVEDLHWCDPSSLELLGRLVAQSATARVLLVGTARPEFAAPWPARSNLQTLTLSRLTKRQTREMIAAVSLARTLSEALVEQLAARADGIPLFAEELTQSVVEADGNAEAMTIPVTLQDSLLARLDRLSSAKEVAQRAAVLGREFSYPLIAAVAGMDEAALQDGLARLVAAELLFVRGVPPEATYTFKHALVQEAAYESLLKRTRQQLHGRVVDVLTKQFPERAAAEPELVARHAELAGRIDEAIALYQRAWDQARARSAYEETVGHVGQAIALLGTQPEGRERDAREAPLQLVLGFSLTVARVYTHPGVEAAFERARVLCETVGDARGLGFALNGLAVFAHNMGQVERAGALAARVLAIAEQINDPGLNVRGHQSLGTVEQYQGRFASSLAHFEAALALYEPGRQDLALVDAAFSIDDRDVPSLAYAVLNLWSLGWPDRALARARETTALARRVDHPVSLAFALLYETLGHQMRRDAAAQRERAAELVAVAETYGFPFWLGLGRTCHAAARVAAGDQEAVADLLPGLVQSGGTGNRGSAPGLFVIVADAYLTAGQLTEARGAVATGLGLAAETGQLFMDAELNRLQGEIVLKTVESREPALSPVEGSSVDSEKVAEECFRRALDIVRAQEAKSLELRAATSLACLWQEQGKRSEARELLNPIYAWFTEGFDTGDLIDAKALLAEL